MCKVLTWTKAEIPGTAFFIPSTEAAWINLDRTLTSSGHQDIKTSLSLFLSFPSKRIKKKETISFFFVSKFGKQFKYLLEKICTEIRHREHHNGILFLLVWQPSNVSNIHRNSQCGCLFRIDNFPKAKPTNFMSQLKPSYLSIQHQWASRF